MRSKPTPIEAWLDEHGDALYQYALIKTNNPDIAADLVQDTFEVVIRSSNRFAGKSQVRSWLIGILRHKITDHYRRKYKESGGSNTDDSQFSNTVFSEAGYWQAHTAPQPIAEADTNLLDDTAFLKVLALCLDKLPSLWKMVLEGKYLQEKETGQLCQELNISTTNLWQINHRAKLSMQQCLQAAWFRDESYGK